MRTKKPAILMAGLLLIFPAIAQAGIWGSMVWGQDTWTRNETTSGAIGATCYDNATCEVGLACSETNLCMDPGAEEGELGGPCHDNQTCKSAELSCIDNICQELPADTGSEGGPCYSDMTCDEDLICIENNNLCVSCPLEYVLRKDKYSLDILRQFRDQILKPSRFGQTIVDTYYRYSPLVNQMLRENPEMEAFFRQMVKSILPAMEILLKSGNP